MREILEPKDAEFVVYIDDGDQELPNLWEKAKLQYL